jgi:hypothetical protein
MYDRVLQRRMFANGGMANAQPPMMQPPMAQPPMAPPTSVGTGITSGLVDPAQEQMAAEQGFAAMAGGMQDMLGQIDAAESTEETINALRGNEASLEDRYSELAELVGNADAKKTPESVLALVQPTFTMMDMVQQESPAGGIADAMPMAGGSSSTGNFNEASPVQAPGMDEAVARMMAGEQPVTANLGGLQNDLVNRPNISIPANVTLNRQPITMTLPNLGATQLPSQATLDQDKVRGYAGDYMSMMRPYLNQMTGGAGPGIDKRMELLAPYLPKQKTSAEIMGEYDELLGTDSMDDAQTQAYLALVQAGQSIAGSDKTLLGAAIDAAGEAAPTLSKIAAKKSADDRASKLAARQESVSREDAIRSAQLGVAQTAISDAARASGTLEGAVLNSQRAAVEYGLKLEGDAVKAVNETAIRNWTANNQYGVTSTETWGKYDPATKKTDIIGVRRTAEGVKYIKDGKYVPVPEGYSPYSKDAFAAKYGTGALDLSKAKRVNLLIPDIATGDTPATGSESGYNQFAGFFNNGAYYYSPTGNPQDAILAPQGFIEGQEKDVLKVAEPDSVGRVFVTVKAGPRAGETFLSSVAGKAIPGASYTLEPAKRDNSNALISGNPLVTTVPNPGVSFANMTPNMVNANQQKVIALSQALQSANEVLPIIGDAVGPLNTVKAWTSNIVGSVAPDSWDGMVEFAATDRGRQRMNMMARNLARGLALSDRYAVREQELITQLNENPEGFWKNPDMSTVRFQELMRILQNELSFSRGVLSDQDNIPVLNAIPTGSKNDPIMFSAPGQYDYLAISAANAGGSDKLKGTFLRMSGDEARARGISVGANQPYIDLEIGVDINF